MLNEEAGSDGFVLRGAVPSSDVIRIRFADVDGLRALAVLLVSAGIVLHVTLRSMQPLTARIADHASAGLALFLAISGFTLAFPAMAVLRQDGGTYLDVGRFAIKRLTRIYPTYLITLVIVAALAAALAARGLANPFGAPTPGSVAANLFFFGDGFNNDGFRAVGLFVRSYLFFPLFLWLWSKRPMWFGVAAAIFALLDLLTPLHAWSIAAFVPFMLGIVAADWRAQVHRFERFGPAILGAGAVLAILCGNLFAALPGRLGSPHGLNVDPFWSIASFGLIVTTGAFRPVERLLSFWMFRVIGAASYAISLAVMPVCAILAMTNGAYASAFAAPAALVVAFVLWQAVDRWFSDESFRRNIATSTAGPIDDALKAVHADRVFLGNAQPFEIEHATPAAPQEEFVPTFYAPPPRPNAADLATVSRRTGSPEELAAEILETKKRLQERSAALFADPPPPPPPPPVYARPGFYKKPGDEKPVLAETTETPETTQTTEAPESAVAEPVTGAHFESKSPQAAHAPEPEPETFEQHQEPEPAVAEIPEPVPAAPNGATHVQVASPPPESTDNGSTPRQAIRIKIGPSEGSGNG